MSLELQLHCTRACSYSLRQQCILAHYAQRSALLFNLHAIHKSNTSCTIYAMHAVYQDGGLQLPERYSNDGGHAWNALDVVIAWSHLSSLSRQSKQALHVG